MRIVLTSVIACLVFVSSAVAEDVYVDVNGEKARLLRCFEEVMMPAKYLVEHVLVTPERRAYVKRRNGTVELVEYPAVYRQERTLLEAHYLELRQIPCKPSKPKWSLFDF